MNNPSLFLNSSETCPVLNRQRNNDSVPFAAKSTEQGLPSMSCWSTNLFVAQILTAQQLATHSGIIG